MQAARRERNGAKPQAAALVNAVSPVKLFAGLPAEPTAAQVVDAAIGRFVQRPLHPDKRATLIGTLGDQPIKFGQVESDRRVREMVSLLLSTPEYQVH
jgi:hypothetical protein